MKLSTAIEYLREYNTERHPYTPKRWSEAQELGIEALKRELNNRSGSKYVIVAPLKGETEE
jgi:hypothetical protein